MHIFGSTCYAYVQNAKKLEAQSKKGVFVGYDKESLVQSNCGLVSNYLQHNFFQRHLIVEWLFNNILKIRQNRFGET